MAYWPKAPGRMREPWGYVGSAELAWEKLWARRKARATRVPRPARSARKVSVLSLLGKRKPRRCAGRARFVIAPGLRFTGPASKKGWFAQQPLRAGEALLRRRMNIELNFPRNSEGLVLGCIDADFIK